MGDEGGGRVWLLVVRLWRVGSRFNDNGGSITPRIRRLVPARDVRNAIPTLRLFRLEISYVASHCDFLTLAMLFPHRSHQLYLFKHSP